MELRQLRYLLAVADAGSFTAAARQSFVTQPTLSTAIGNLESELGQRLFDRTPRGAALTTAGRRAVAHARVAVAATEALRAADDTGRGARTLRVGAAPTLPSELVTSTVDTFGVVLPGRGVRLEAGSLTALRRLLVSGRLDVLITVLNDTPGADVRQLELGRDDMCLLFPPATRPASPVAPDALHGAPLVVRTHCEFLSVASRILDERRIRPRIVARVDTDALAVALVVAGQGACLMPDSFASEAAPAVEVEGLDLRRRLGLEWTDPELDSLGDVGPATRAPVPRPAPPARSAPPRWP